MSDNAFRALRANGYANVLPIIPPGVEVHENSSVARSVGKPNDSRGKSPGVKRGDKWTGLPDWQTRVASDADAEAWHAMGASVGLRMGNGVICVDIDALQPQIADQIEADALAAFGPSPQRVGQWPKRALFYRIDEDTPYQTVEFATDNPDKNDKIEFACAGRQMALLGVHPKTGKPYQWPRPLVAKADLSLISATQLADFIAQQRAKLPAATHTTHKSGAERAVNQDGLRGEPDMVVKAMRSLPNNRDLFKDRDDYIRVGAAVKGALPDDAGLAFDLWTEWAEKDNGGTPDVWDKDWRGIKPPFAVGANWLYDQAARLSPDAFNVAEVHFEELPDEIENPFAQQEAAQAQHHASDLYPLLHIGELINRPPPSFLIDRHIPDVSVGFLYSAPGAGKSFLAIDMALAIAHGDADWNGDAIKAKPDARSLYIASEGSFDLGNRVKASHKAKGREGFTDRFLVIEKTIQFMKTEDIDKLLRTIRAAGVKPALVVVDTVSRAMPGADENLQKDMTLFVAACDRVRDEFQCAVLGVHHAGKSGDMRGSTVLLGAGDFVFKLERKKGASIGTLTCEKQKAAEDGWAEPYRFDRVDLGAGQSSLVPVREVVGFGPDAELTPQVTERVLAAMDAAWQAGSPWAKAAQSGDRRAVYHMVQDFGFKGADAEDVLSLWEKTGLIVVAVRDAKSKVKGYQVVGGAGQPVLSEGIFD